MNEVSPEEVKAAIKRYPGIPITLAISRYMLDKQLENEPIWPLHHGLGWGGVHLDAVGELVQKLANAMYEQRKKALIITIEATDFPESWDHIWLEIKDVDSGTPKKIGRMGLFGWPCCACDEIITGEDVHAVAVMLEKHAKWQYPTWGNALRGTSGLALAALCGRCAGDGRQPIYAVKKVDNAAAGRFERVPLTELQNVNSPTKRTQPEIEATKHGNDEWPPTEPVEEKTPDDVTPEDVPDLNAVFRVCFHFWQVPPEAICKQLGFKNIKDAFTARISPWDTFLTIKSWKQPKTE